jgi:type I restriction enzyme R subunit
MDRIDIMQSQNFEFLRGTWPELASLAGFAEHYAYLDPQSAQINLDCRVHRKLPSWSN